MIDLSDFLKAAYDKPKMSYRKLAEYIGISKTTVEKIVKRRLKKMPELETLEKIAKAYDLTTPAVVEMAGAMMGDTEKYTQIARELATRPWIAEEWKFLTSLTKEEFAEAKDYMGWRKRHPSDRPPPLPNDDQSSP